MHSRSDMTPARPIRSRLFALLAGALALVGCAASLPGLGSGGTSAAGGVIHQQGIVATGMPLHRGNQGGITAVARRDQCVPEQSPAP